MSDLMEELLSSKKGRKTMSDTMKVTLVALAILFCFIIVDLIGPAYGFFGRVPTGSVGIVTRFGKVKDDSLSEGMHVKGFFDRINNLTTRTQKTERSLSAFSKDIQQVDLNIVINYSVDKVTAASLFKQVGINYEEKLILPAILEKTKVVIARYTAEGLISSRDELSDAIRTLLVDELQSTGIIVSMVAVEDIDFTDAFTDAVERKQVATQNKLTAQTEQERLTAETQAKAERDKIEAQAAAEVAKTKAEAEAYAIKVKADAEAEANKKLSESLTKDLIEYIYANGWDGKLPETVLGDGTNAFALIGGEGR